MSSRRTQEVALMLRDTQEVQSSVSMANMPVLRLFRCTEGGRFRCMGLTMVWTSLFKSTVSSQICCLCCCFRSPDRKFVSGHAAGPAAGGGGQNRGGDRGECPVASTGGCGLFKAAGHGASEHLDLSLSPKTTASNKSLFAQAFYFRSF